MSSTIQLKKKSKLDLVAPVPEPEVVSDFDYAILDDAVAVAAKQSATRIRSRINDMKVDIIEIGNDLLTMKKKLPHGEFGKWITAEFGMTDRTARRYMLAAEKLSSISDTVSDLPVKVLHALAAPSTPPDVKKAVADGIKAGKKPTTATVTAMIKEAKAVKPSPAAKTSPKAKAIKSDTVSEQMTQTVDQNQSGELDKKYVDAGKSMFIDLILANRCPEYALKMAYYGKMAGCPEWLTEALDATEET